MNLKLKMATMFAAFGILTASAAICPAQRIVGGFSDAAKTDETVVAAAHFAVAARAQTDATLELVTIQRAERQIVAGSNYRLCLNVKSKNKPEQATATVYLNLQNEFSLSEWIAGKCGGAATQTTKVAVAMPEAETVTYKGDFQVGKLKSVILYVGEETGDYAAFCFTNKSEVGRAVLAACKNGEQCEFTGEVDFDDACQVPNLEANLSASGTITKITSVKKIAPKMAATVKTVTVAGQTTVTVAAVPPDVIVKDLYAAQKNVKTAPFFQYTNRAAVDRFFTTDFADLIWKDAVTAKGEVGAIAFDPLYGSQDPRVTAFKIGKPEIADRMATVLVEFKNMGKADTVSYIFERVNEVWKITDVRYRNGDMLKGILFAAQR